MAKKKGLRRRLLGSTKTGRLVRAASLAGVLGGGSYLLSRRKGVPAAPSPVSTPTSPKAAGTPAYQKTVTRSDRQLRNTRRRSKLANKQYEKLTTRAEALRKGELPLNAKSANNFLSTLARTNDAFQRIDSGSRVSGVSKRRKPSAAPNVGRFLGQGSRRRVRGN